MKWGCIPSTIQLCLPQNLVHPFTACDSSTLSSSSLSRGSFASSGSQFPCATCMPCLYSVSMSAKLPGAGAIQWCTEVSVANTCLTMCIVGMEHGYMYQEAHHSLYDSCRHEWRLRVWRHFIYYKLPFCGGNSISI